MTTIRDPSTGETRTVEKPAPRASKKAPPSKSGYVTGLAATDDQLKELGRLEASRQWIVEYHRRRQRPPQGSVLSERDERGPVSRQENYQGESS